MKHLSGKKICKVALSYSFKCCVKTICLFHPVNNDCIVRIRNYNNCIIESILR